MAVRYKRFLTVDTKSVQDLITFIINLDVGDKFAFDVHLREKNKVMVYHGNTCVLLINLSHATPFSAHSEYGKKPASAVAYARMKTLRNHPDDFPGIADYLRAVVQAVTSKYAGEGLWMNKLGMKFGRECRPNDEFVIIDRECVLGFENSSEKKAYYTPLKNSRTQIVGDLQKRDPSFGTTMQTFGDELDLLALDRNGHLACIELKFGSNTAGIYWGPLQASLYHDVFMGAINTISGDLIKMIHQKIDLGLLPEWVAKRVPQQGAFPGVRGILAVAEPKDKGVGFNKAATVNAYQKSVGIAPVEIIAFDTTFNMTCK